MHKFNPDIYQKNVFDIDYDKIKEKGIKLLCFDLDNTLDAPDNMTDKKDDQVENLMNKLQKDFEVLIVSNNTIKGRVSSFANLYDLEYIEAMRKPFQKKYKNNKVIAKYKKGEILFVGDKIITDILGARIFGSYCALVDSLYPKKKVWYNQLMNVIDKAFSMFSKVKRKEYFNNI